MVKFVVVAFLFLCIIINGILNHEVHEVSRRIIKILTKYCSPKRLFIRYQERFDPLSVSSCPSWLTAFFKIIYSSIDFQNH
jgi:hypothetical protein